MIPYNPSSFNTNKTILEQILELKNWLKQHPSYKIYYCISNFMPTGDDDRAFTEIAGDPDEVANIAVGDLLVFPDAYYSEVIAVDYDNELVTIALPATNFKGPQGATGPAGLDGTCIRKYSGNSNANPSTLYAISNLNFSTGLQQYDLIYFNDGYAGFVSNVNVGLSSFQISTRFYVNGINGTDGAYVSNAEVDANGDLIITIYNPATSSTIQVNAGYVVGPQGPSNPEGTAVLSTGVTSGDVLTANGDGTSSWQTPATPSVEGTSVLSTGATSGQVLQADGNGGASWQNAGGSTIYTHCIYIESTTPYSVISVVIRNTTSTAYTKTAFISLLASKGLNTPSNALTASGYIYYSSKSCFIYKINENSDTLNLGYYTEDGTIGNTWISAGQITTFVDKVVTNI